MKVNTLKLQNFRNLQEISLTPCAGVNLIYGDNAQGKTNLLEAFWLLTGAKSFRGAKDADFIRFGEQFATLEAAFERGGREQLAKMYYGAKKQAWLNEIALSSASGFAGVYCAVVFSPSHLALVQAGPGERRRLLDTGISQLSPGYVRLLADYNRTLLQRGSLLRDSGYSSALPDTLEIWDEKLAALGALLVRQRTRYVARLAPAAQEVYRGLSGKCEELSLGYEVSGLSETYDEDGYQKWLVGALRQNRAEDIRCKSTSVGPHRDDLDLRVNGVGLRCFGSQGQQRSAVLALKLAESRLLEELIEDAPLILLDDVMSELDENRQNDLLKHFSSNQVFITCCDPTHFKTLKGGRVFWMEHGRLNERN